MTADGSVTPTWWPCPARASILGFRLSALNVLAGGGAVRVLFSSTPAVGHVQPMLPLALHLKAAGHQVLWATGADGGERVRASGIDTALAGWTAPERLRAYRERWPEASSLQGEALTEHMFPRLFGLISAHAAFDDLLAIGRRYSPDVVISEAGDFAAPIVAADLAVPQVTHAFGTIIPKERVQAAAAETTDLWNKISQHPRPFGGCYDHLYLDIYPASLSAQDLSHIRRVQRVRPGSLNHRVGGELPADVAQLLGGDKPILYLTFGTVFNNNPAFSAAVAAVARVPDIAAIVTVGPVGDPDMFGSQPPHVRIARYIPQDLLFPRCAVVISHGGSGTVLGALAAGIPQICLPQAADQFRNARACTAAGAGVDLLGDAVTVTAVERQVGRVLNEESFRHGAQKVADDIATMPTVADAAATIEELVSTSAH